MNKILGVFLMISLLACLNKKSNDDKGKQHYEVSDKKTGPALLTTQSIHIMDSLNIVKNKLDSLISIQKNNKNGYYYFQRADCLTAMEDFKAAISDLKIAKQLNYLPERCNELIEFNGKLLEIRNSYN